MFSRRDDNHPFDSDFGIQFGRVDEWVWGERCDVRFPISKFSGINPSRLGTKPPNTV